jgi:hypothetical protein
MKNPYLPLVVLAGCVSALSSAQAAAQDSRVVAADGRASAISCEAANPAPRTIQAAVDLSSSGDTILVCPGVYEEQVKIVAKDLTIRGVTSGPLNQVLIKPQGMVPNSSNAFSGTPIAAVIAVEDSGKVILRNLTVDGADNQLTECSPTLVGIFYRNASGEVQASAVRDIRLGSSLETCQSGYGIFAQSAAGGAAKLSVEDSSVHGYQKVGILANEAGTELQAISSAVTGDGPTTVIAQNGIQVGFGATGRVAGNSVLNHVYSCETADCDVATNILLFEADSVTIAGNTTGKAVISIFLAGSNNSNVRDNMVSASELLDGISVLGNRNHIIRNRIFDSDEFALSVQGNNNLVEFNLINDSPCGIFSNGNGNRLRLNTIFNTELATCEPFTLFSFGLSLNARARSAFSSGLLLGDSSTTARRDGSGFVLRGAAPAR